MNAIETVDAIVKTMMSKEAQYDYGNGVSGPDPEAAKLLDDLRKKSVRHSRPSGPRSVGLSQRTAPPGRSNGTGFTGTEIRHGGSAPVGRVPSSKIRPRYATNVMMRDNRGRPYLAGGGRADIGANGKPTGTVGGQPVRRWEDLQSTRMMMAANDPTQNTPEVRAQKAMAYMPNSRRRALSSIAYGNQHGGPAAKPFNFKEEAYKILNPMVSKYRNNKGKTPVGVRNLASKFRKQLADMQANPGRYSEQRQRAILEDWRRQMGSVA